MLILTTAGWPDYELLDSGSGQRLERFGEYLLVRPDPQIIWQPHLPESEWKSADAIFKRTEKDQGKWLFKNIVKKQWLLKYRNISFYCKFAPFKHTGVFPEQTIQWEWISQLLHPLSPTIQPHILNLFAYTGIASLIAVEAGAKVTHVDASFPTIGWARENQKASGLDNKPIRWILDDALKFCEREVRRGVKYDGIIMDPPVFGHGPGGERWDFNESFPKLMEVCQKLLSKNPLFVLVNAYAISTSAITLENVLKDYLTNLDGKFESGELALQEKNTKRLLSTGIFARWSR